MHWNCNSLLGKVPELHLYIEEQKPDIILLNEIKASQEVINSEFNLNGYTTESKIRNVNPECGGGVAIFIKNNIIYERILDFEYIKPLLELLCIRVRTHLFPIHIICYYNPTTESISIEFFKKLKKLRAKCIIGGDLNSKKTDFGCKKNNKNMGDSFLWKTGTSTQFFIFFNPN
jgi:exonuclease III